MVHQRAVKHVNVSVKKKMKKNNLRIVLGSNSPQRKKILSLFDFDFITDKANIDESNISHNLSPERYTSILAKKER